MCIDSNNCGVGLILKQTWYLTLHVPALFSHKLIIYLKKSPKLFSVLKPDDYI